MKVRDSRLRGVCKTGYMRHCAHRQLRLKSCERSVRTTVTEKKEYDALFGNDDWNNCSRVEGPGCC